MDTLKIIQELAIIARLLEQGDSITYHTAKLYLVELKSKLEKEITDKFTR